MLADELTSVTVQPANVRVMRRAEKYGLAAACAVADSLVGVLAHRQLLFVLDNCEHVAGAVAELCGGLLLVADEIRVLATGCEPLGGETRFRLPPLGPDGWPEQAAQLWYPQDGQIAG